MSSALLPFLLGAAVMASATIGLFFARFWIRTRDRLFLAFALAFWLFAANWAVLAALPHEGYPAVYLCRLVGFILIIAGVIDKNRAARP